VEYQWREVEQRMDKYSIEEVLRVQNSENIHKENPGRSHHQMFLLHPLVYTSYIPAFSNKKIKESVTSIDILKIKVTRET